MFEFNLLTDSADLRALGVLGITLFSLIWILKTRWSSDFPLVGSAEDFASDSYSVLDQGMREHDGPFRVQTVTGPKIVLPARYLEDIKNDDRFSFAHEMAKASIPPLARGYPSCFSSQFDILSGPQTDMHIQQSLSHLPGFEAFATPLHNNIFQDTIRIKITQSLGAITHSLSQETSLSMKELIGDSPEWRNWDISKDVLNLTTRLSTRVFLGEKFSRNQVWLNLTLAYTMTALHAAQQLLKWPSCLQRPANWFLPVCVGQRAMRQQIRGMLEPEIVHRRRSRAESKKSDEKPLAGRDTLDWMDEIAQGRPFDLVFGQLQLNFVAIHTTSTLMTDVLLDLCAFPKYIPKLREEVIQVLQTEGWKKTAMYKLKLMDSFIKETLRLRGQSMITARRMTTETIRLPDGTKIPKGCSTMVPTTRAMMAPEVYANPEQFDGERFLRMRDVNENGAQLVTTSTNYLGFGIGKHACPGRFLAANEIKVALCHFLLKYDISFLDGQTRPEPLTWETAYITNPDLKIRVRRRKAEMDLDI